MIKTKICGVTDKVAVDTAVRNGAEYIGFVFYPKSPRNITPEKAAIISCDILKGVKKVAVVVNPLYEDLQKIMDHFTPDYLQLHGDETPERVREIKSKFHIPVIKAFSVRSGDDIARSGAYTEVADMLLFDARQGVLPGGNGIAFDWNLLAKREFPIPWILSGGLNHDNLAEAVRITDAEIVDASSSLEKEPGRKDPQLIDKFLKAANRLSS